MRRSDTARATTNTAHIADACPSERGMQAHICCAGVVIASDMIRKPEIAAYIKTLTHRYAPRIGAIKYCAVYRTVTQKNGIKIYILPRSALGILRALKCTLVRRRAPNVEIQFRESLDFLYDDQRLIVAHICNILAQSPAPSACLNLRAGYGKTFIAAGLITSLRARALYIVPTRELAKQTQRDLRAIADDPASIVYVASSKELRDNCENDARETAVCIVVINTILAMSAREDTHKTAQMIARAFSLTIFDEAHTYCSPKRMNIFWLAQTRYMFGMSATVGERRDGFDFALNHHLYPMVDAENIDGFSYGESVYKCHVRAIRYYARAEFAQNLRHEATDQVFAHYMYEQFARDTFRTQIIVDSARTLLRDNHNLFIFAEERIHVEKIAAALCDAGVATMDARVSSKPRCVIFYGGISEEERKIALCPPSESPDGAQENAARVIVATYSYSGTGVSITRMTAMILASPRYSGMKQIVGRILRRGSDPSIPRIIVDLIDQKTCLAHQFRLRANAYNYYGADCEITKIRDDA